MVDGFVGRVVGNTTVFFIFNVDTVTVVDLVSGGGACAIIRRGIRVRGRGSDLEVRIGGLSDVGGTGIVRIGALSGSDAIGLFCRLVGWDLRAFCKKTEA